MTTYAKSLSPWFQIFKTIVFVVHEREIEIINHLSIRVSLWAEHGYELKVSMIIVRRHGAHLPLSDRLSGVTSTNRTSRTLTRRSA